MESSVSAARWTNAPAGRRPQRGGDDGVGRVLGDGFDHGAGDAGLVEPVRVTTDEVGERRARPIQVAGVEGGGHVVRGGVERPARGAHVGRRSGRTDRHAGEGSRARPGGGERGAGGAAVVVEPGLQCDHGPAERRDRMPRSRNGRLAQQPVENDPRCRRQRPPAPARARARADPPPIPGSVPVAWRPHRAPETSPAPADRSHHLRRPVVVPRRPEGSPERLPDRRTPPCPLRRVAVARVLPVTHPFVRPRAPSPEWAAPGSEAGGGHQRAAAARRATVSPMTPAAPSTSPVKPPRRRRARATTALAPNRRPTPASTPDQPAAATTTASATTRPAPAATRTTRDERTPAEPVAASARDRPDSDPPGTPAASRPAAGPAGGCEEPEPGGGPAAGTGPRLAPRGGACDAGGVAPNAAARPPVRRA